MQSAISRKPSWLVVKNWNPKSSKMWCVMIIKWVFWCPGSAWEGEWIATECKEVGHDLENRIKQGAIDLVWSGGSEFARGRAAPCCVNELSVEQNRWMYGRLNVNMLFRIQWDFSFSGSCTDAKNRTLSRAWKTQVPAGNSCLKRTWKQNGRTRTTALPAGSLFSEVKCQCLNRGKFMFFFYETTDKMSSGPDCEKGGIRFRLSIYMGK